MWKKCLDCIDELLNVLYDNDNMFIGDHIAEDSENLAISDQVTAAELVTFLREIPPPHPLPALTVCLDRFSLSECAAAF